MKKLRAIAIKNPKLIKIRNNLRKIWIQALIEQKDKFLKELCSPMLSNDGFNNFFKNIPQDKLDTLLNTVENFFSKPIINELEKSICMCAHCWKMDQNMVFIPKIQKWWCFHCYITAKFFPKRFHPTSLYNDWITKVRSLYQNEI